MEQIIINFWWTGETSSARLHWLPADALRKSVSESGLGFRNLYDFNLAFIAKMAWRVLINPEALWTQLLKGLYFARTDFMEATRHCKSSWIWSGIMEGKKALLQGLRKNIGDGHGTSIIEAWIPEAYPGFIGQCSNVSSTTTVADYILNPQRIWNVAKLRSVFSEHVVKQILLIPLGPEGFSDCFVWHFESSWIFSVKSCYKLLQANRGSSSHPLDSSTRNL
ncbi:Uncharacterized mitochondrial protein AtMg00310 [Linum perenne]